MYNVEINEIHKIIEAAPIKLNLMFVGDTGIGKTTAIENYCKKNDIYLKTLILSQLEASETLGIPVKVDREFQGKVYPVLETAIPSWVFDLVDEKNSILFLDEFLCAQPSVMNAFLNFLTQKNVSGIDLSHVRILAATNIGNYTFEPDNNILSRFCFFYTINSNSNDFIGDKRIINNYKDENPQEGIIFEERSLKPRCHELLKYVSDEHLAVFYEGFTNKRYIIIHEDVDINNVALMFVEVKGFKSYNISEPNILLLCETLLIKFNKIKKWDVIISKFINLDFNTVKKIETKINELYSK